MDKAYIRAYNLYLAPKTVQNKLYKDLQSLLVLKYSVQTGRWKLRLYSNYSRLAYES